MKYSLKRLFKNLRFLMKYNLNEKQEELKLDVLKSVEDIYYYEILDNDKDSSKYMLDVLNYNKTIDLLLDKPKSFCRFGDADIEIMKGNNCPYQKYDERLKNILLEILEKDNEKLYVGINYNYFHSISNLNEFNKKFYLLHVPKYRKFLLKHCNKGRQYIAAGFTQLYTISTEYNYFDYFKKIKLLFKDRELVIVAGNGILDKLQFDIFELAKSKEYIKAPNFHAFSEFDKLLNEALSYPPRQKDICIYIRTLCKSFSIQTYRKRISSMGYWAFS